MADIDPPPELPADCSELGHFLETEFFVERDAGNVGPGNTVGNGRRPLVTVFENRTRLFRPEQKGSGRMAFLILPRALGVIHQVVAASKDHPHAIREVVRQLSRADEHKSTGVIQRFFRRLAVAR